MCQNEISNIASEENKNMHTNFKLQTLCIKRGKEKERKYIICSYIIKLF